MRCVLAFLVTCLGIAGTAGAVPLLPKHPPVAKHRTRIGDWRLDVARNPFWSASRGTIRAG
jgi:hypothetical protein